jgi:hypothetical protein
MRRPTSFNVPSADLIVEGEIDTVHRNGNRPRLRINNRVVDICEDLVGRNDVNVTIGVLIPRGTHLIGEVRVGLVIEQLTYTHTHTHSHVKMLKLIHSRSISLIARVNKSTAISSTTCRTLFE